MNTTGIIRTSSAPRVLLNETRHAAREAEKMISTAGLVAEKLIEQAKTQADAIRKKARIEGLASGKQEAMTIILESNSYRKRLEEDAKLELIDLCITLLKKITAIHRSNYREWIVDRVKIGLNDLRDQRFVKVRINPEDLRLFREKILESAQIATLDATVSLVSDPSLQNGDCVFESPAGTINSCVSECIKVIRTHILNTLNDDVMKGETDERKK